MRELLPMAVATQCASVSQSTTAASPTVEVPPGEAPIPAWHGACWAARVPEERKLHFTRAAYPLASPRLGLLVGLLIVVPAVTAAVTACNAVTSIAVQGADFGGASANAYCDRRYVSDGGTPSAFCQEIVGTLAASQFADDCRNNHQATPGPGLCPRASIIAGCKLNENNSDGSQVWDWYYDVSIFPDAGPDGAPYFDPPVATSVASVALVCADTSRYPQGAELTLP